MKEIKRLVISGLLFVGVLALAMGGLNSIEKKSSAEELQSLEEHMKKAVITCYALEGRYPPNVQYLYDNYGFHWNEKKYHIHYEIFAENIMPEITIVEE